MATGITPNTASSGPSEDVAHVFENQRWVAGVWSKPLALLDVDPYEFVDEQGKPVQAVEWNVPSTSAWSVRVVFCVVFCVASRLGR